MSCDCWVREAGPVDVARFGGLVGRAPGSATMNGVAGTFAFAFIPCADGAAMVCHLLFLTRIRITHS